MHESSLNAMRRFHERYVAKLSQPRILEVGSLDVNGSYREIFSQTPCEYVGVDVIDGPGVDLVVQPWRWSVFDDSDFDVVISGQCLEHDKKFWLTLGEIGRVLSPGGVVCVIAPSLTKYHHPPDYWRFMQDAPLVWAELIGVIALTTHVKRKPPHGDAVLIGKKV